MTHSTRTILCAIVALLASLLLVGCAMPPNGPGPVQTAGLAIGAAALAWIDSLLASGALTPEQAGEWKLLVGTVGTSAEAFVAAARASGQAIAALRGQLAEVQASQWTTEQVGGLTAAGVALSAAAVQKLRGPSATPDERQRRKAARAPRPAT
jgi:hypothetical protein